MSVATPDHARVVMLTDGQRIGLAVFGDPKGLPVLALHGAPACRMMFEVAAGEARAKGLKLIAPDRPGYALSPSEKDHVTLESRAAQLMSFADTIGLERFALLGVSGGGPYAVAVAAKAPSRITALSLVAPVGPIAECNEATHTIPRAQRMFFIDMPLHHPHIVRSGAHASAFMFRLAPHMTAASLAWTLGGADHDILRKPEVERVMISMTTEALEHGIEGAMADLEIYARPWNVAYDRISARTTLWQGDEDIVVPPQATYCLARKIPGARLNRIKGAGHFWIFDHIGEVLADLGENAAASA